VFLVIPAVLSIVLALNWPLWMGGFILAGIVGFILIFWFIRRILLERRHKNFVNQVIALNESSLKHVDMRKSGHLQDFQTRWKKTLDKLKSPYLKKYENPLYILPWYLVIGESGSGKTSVIKNAGLSPLLAGASQISGIFGTSSCDWWFFEQVVLVDTAGRYTTPVDEKRDRNEWYQFLSLLAKYRKKEPLNGLVVTVAADMLLQSTADHIQETGRSIRKRVDELMRILGTKFPVYILVTKCDLILGMTQFCDLLEENALQKALGVIKQEPMTEIANFVSNAVSTVAERLRDLRLFLLYKSSTSGYTRITGDGADPSLILLADKYEQIKSGLTAFMQEIFQPDPYQEKPILRGLYFSSGRQEGTPYSHFLKSIGAFGVGDVPRRTDQGLFLHNLFAKLLPNDRRLFISTTRAIRWGRLTRKIGPSAWVTLIIALCGLLSFSFVKNLQIIRGVSRQFAAAQVLEGDIITILDRTDRYRQAIAEVEFKNQHWWIPRFGLNESIEVEHHLKDSYCDKFRNELTIYYDMQLKKEMKLGSDMSDTVLGRYATHLSRRINLLKAGLKGGDLSTFKTLPQPAYEPALLMVDGSQASEIDSFFTSLNHSYLAWNTDTGQLNEELEILQSWLAYLLSMRKTSINWLVDWVNANLELSHVRLETFWGDDIASSDTISIPPAFTGEGKQLIDGLIQEIETALADPMVMTEKRPAFKRWYTNAYVKVWYDFGEHFPKGEYWLIDRSAWQRLALIMAKDQGPYFALLDRMAVELEPIELEGDRTLWVSLVRDLRAARITAMAAKRIPKAGVLEKAAETGKKLLRKLDSEAGDSEPASTVSVNLMAAKAYKEYREALLVMTLAAESQKVAYEMTVEYFKEDPATSKTAFFAAFKALKRLRVSLGEGFVEQGMFWRLVTGPLTFMRDYVNLESACYLNRLWEQDVLVEIKGMSDKTAVNQHLFGADGYATKFIKGPAEPFLGRSLEKGYYARKTLDRRLPFTDDFLFFLTRSTEVSKFKPKFETNLGQETEIPTDDETAELLKWLSLRDSKESEGKMNIEVILAQWKAERALKELKEQQAREQQGKQEKMLAQQEKQAFEARIPDVPRDIAICWDD
jgi:type VI secretion system protein ImpL